MSVSYKNEKKTSLERLKTVFGLTIEDIQDILMQGVIARCDCTAHHPRTYAGLAQWAETVRAFRDKTVPLGWTMLNDDNFPLSIHPDQSVAILVQTGDRETGIRTGNPSNKALKGKNTEVVVAKNERQLSLFEDFPEEATTDQDGFITWILLHRYTERVLYSELSLPRRISGGKVQSWEERIVFTPMQIDQIKLPIQAQEDTLDIEVPIQRKN